MFAKMERYYLFTGDLVLQTALHIGGGDAAMGATDNPVIRTIEGQPFIPGSSLKGAFRSTVEKLAATLSLPNMDWDVLETGSARLREFNEELNNCRKTQCHETKRTWTDEDTIAMVKEYFPETALLFGNPYTASKLFFADAMLKDEQALALIERRDGVAIDRDSERAMDALKYDYEVVPSSTCFTFELRLENPTDRELALTCLGLSEMVSGFFGLGGKRSSGMGRCMLDNLQVYALDLTTGNPNRAEALRRYLTGTEREDKMERLRDGLQFIHDHLIALLKEVA
ncbi:MAG: CRISPR-associated RAMP protein [Chloroflexaceae bacterium]|nr:CRISPR-associated RAMP protein [Chloroflexaceae bacterium]